MSEQTKLEKFWGPRERRRHAIDCIESIDIHDPAGPVLLRNALYSLLALDESAEDRLDALESRAAGGEREGVSQCPSCKMIGVHDMGCPMGKPAMNNAPEPGRLIPFDGMLPGVAKALRDQTAPSPAPETDLLALFRDAEEAVGHVNGVDSANGRSRERVTSAMYKLGQALAAMPSARGPDVADMLRNPANYPGLIRACAIAGHRACSPTTPTENGTWVPDTLQAVLDYASARGPTGGGEQGKFTPPFGELVAHLKDCAGGCPFCVELCQRVASEAETNEILRDPQLMDAIKQSEEDIKAGRTVPHEVVMREMQAEPPQGGEIGEGELRLVQSHIASGNVVWTETERLLKAYRAARAEAEGARARAERAENDLRVKGSNLDGLREMLDKAVRAAERAGYRPDEYGGEETLDTAIDKLTAQRDSERAARGEAERRVEQAVKICKTALGSGAFTDFAADIIKALSPDGGAATPARGGG